MIRTAVMKGWLIAAAAAFGMTTASACSSSDEGATARRPRRDEARDLVAGMQGYWGSFASNGAPQHEGSPAWPSFGADEKHVSLDVPISVGEGHERDDCDFWDTIPQPQLSTFYPPP